MTGVITQFTKFTVGRPRPGTYVVPSIAPSNALLDVIDRCQPPSGYVDPPFGLSTAAICTQTDMSILKDGFRSFPSGHSSLSFAGLGFLAFYLGKRYSRKSIHRLDACIYPAGKLHLFDHKAHIVRIIFVIL